jgi:hypothetical protein
MTGHCRRYTSAIVNELKPPLAEALGRCDTLAATRACPNVSRAFDTPCAEALTTGPTVAGQDALRRPAGIC